VVTETIKERVDKEMDRVLELRTDRLTVTETKEQTGGQTDKEKSSLRD